MEYRTLKLTLQYAYDLHKVNLVSKMNVYAVVSISGGDKSSRQRTETLADRDGGANPTWCFPMKFTVEEAALQQNRLVLDFVLVCKRALGDKHIGEAHVPVKELLDPPAAKGKRKFVSYQVRKPNGKPKGHITFSYQFIGKNDTSTAMPPQPVMKVDAESMTVHPVGPSLVYPAMAPVGYSPLSPPSLGHYPQPIGCPSAGGPMLGEYYFMAGYGYYRRPPALSGCGYPQSLPGPGAASANDE